MTLHEIEQCFQVLVHAVRERGLGEIRLPATDGYWTITSPEWRNIYETPAPAVGSFADDNDELRKLLADPERASAVDLERLAHLLLLLSDQLAEPEVFDSQTE